jgi:hypothetical protein
MRGIDLWRSNRVWIGRKNISLSSAEEREIAVPNEVRRYGETMR